MKLCGKMVEAGQAYSAAHQLFLSSLTQLSVFQEKPSVVTVRTLVVLMLIIDGSGWRPLQAGGSTGGWLTGLNKPLTVASSLRLV